MSDPLDIPRKRMEAYLMKKCIKALALILTIAILAAIPAVAESADDGIDVVTLLGTDIDETGAMLGLEKTQTEGVDDAYLTLYEGEDLWIGGLNGVVVSIMVFDGTYEVLGVRIGMTAEAAKAALTATGVEFTDGEVEGIGTPTIDFALPGREDAAGCFELDDDGIVIYERIEVDCDPTGDVE